MICSARKPSAFASALAAALLACGCSSTPIVDDDLVDVFPVEGRRWTYEAENEVIIALDRLDAARDRERALEDQLDEFEIPKKAAKVHRAKQRWLEQDLAHAEADVDAAEVEVECARASLELTKARLAIRFDLPVEEDYVEPFEAAYKSCAEDRQGEQAAVQKRLVGVKKARDDWRKVRKAYVQSTGDYNHGLWID